MRRVILVALFAAASVGLFTLPAAADNSGNGNVVLSFDFNDNGAPAALSNNNGTFNVIADVLPEHTGGAVRMVAVAPDNSGVSNLVCPFQPVQQSQVECTFNFTSNGVWTVKAQYAADAKSDVTSVSITRLRVAN
jgi:hypothetical protein